MRETKTHSCPTCGRKYHGTPKANYSLSSNIANEAKELIVKFPLNVMAVISEGGEHIAG